MQGSNLAQEAVFAACRCELRQTWLEDDEEPIGVRAGWEAYDAARRERSLEVQVPLYMDALLAIADRFPMKVCCELFELGMCEHGTPCECGGTQAPWPWIIHHPRESRFCDCHLLLRRDWVAGDLDGGPASSPKSLWRR